MISYDPIVLQEVTVPSERPTVDKQRMEQLFTHISTQKMFRDAYSMLIITDGTIIAEGYFNGYRPDQRQNIKSTTKSIVSLLTGVALDKGYFTGVDQPLSEIFPEYFNDTDFLKKSITLHHALTMQTGLKWYENMEWFFNVSWHPNWMFRSRNTVRYVLNRNTEDIPGGHFHYSTGTSQLLAGAIAKTTGQSVYDFAQENLFLPLGLDKVTWVAGKDGIHYGGVQLYMTPREMAMIGQLCIQNGRWKGQQLVSEEWMNLSTQGHTYFHHENGPYGYHWWVNPLGYSAQGYGGQYIYVLPHQNTVVVFTARNNRPRHIPAKVVEQLIKEYVIQAQPEESARVK
jgi:CubicO group peptidase (beta-lactamase class C family)